MKRAREDEAGQAPVAGGAAPDGERRVESPYHGEGVALGMREVPQLTRKAARFFCRNCSRDVTLEPRMKCATCPPGFVLCLTCFR
jgi:hypothetical protein